MTSAGSAGSSAGGSATASGGAQAEAGAGSQGGSVPAGSQGVQADPGSEGDGTYPQPEPYEQPAETMARVAGAPVGMTLSNLKYTSQSAYPGLTFQYWIYVPAQYQPGKPAALMVYQDGSHYLGYTEAAFYSQIVFDNLIYQGDMPVTIGVFIQPGTESGLYVYPDDQGTRSMQYDTPSDQYSQFLLDEFLPDAILSQYDIVDDAEGWGIGGHSSGGICAFMVGWYRPDKFRKLLTHNASFSNTDGAFPAAINAEPQKPLRVYLLSSPNDLGGWFDANNDAAAALEAKGYHYRYRTGSGMHYPPTQAVADYPEALRWMWRGYTLPWY